MTLPKVIQVFIFVFCVFLSFGTSFAFFPVATDSRIKTFVYNENDVFNIVVHYGYQSSIEFAKNEDIQAISMGNSFAWKYSTFGRRLFITALEGAAHTNMTVITNKRTYQFDIESREPSKGVDSELVYVVRFFYPDKSFETPAPKVDVKKFIPKQIVSEKSYNFNYSLQGSEVISPEKVFNDGKKTYLKFKNNNADVPNIFVVADDGSEKRAKYTREGEYIVIQGVAKKLALRLLKDLAYVYSDMEVK